MKRNTTIGRGGIIALFTLLAIPLVKALDPTSIGQTAGTAWNMVGSFFSFQFISQNQAIQVGVIKFLVFLLLMRVVQVALSIKDGKPFDRKTSGVIGFVVAGITVIFTPNAFIFSGIVALLVPAMVTGYIAKKALVDMRKGWAGLLGLGFLIIDTVLMWNIILIYEQHDIGVLSWFVFTIFNAWYVILFALCILKFISLFFTNGGMFSVVDGHHAHDAHDGPSDSHGGDHGIDHGDGHHGAHDHELGEHEDEDLPQPPDPETIRDQLPEGFGAISVIVVDGVDPRKSIPNAEIWIESRGGMSQKVSTDPDGTKIIPVKLPLQDIIVHAKADGFEEGIHLDRHGFPDTTITLTAEIDTAKAKVPLPHIEIDPTPFDKDKHPIGKQVFEDRIRPEDQRYKPKKKKLPPEKRTYHDLVENFCPIEDQGTYGACTAMAAGAMWEYHWNRENDAILPKNDRLSKMYYWIKTRAILENDPSPSMWGSTGYHVMKHLRKKGVCREGFWPWSSQTLMPPDPNQDASVWQRAEQDAPHQRIKLHAVISKDDIAGTILDNHPVFAVIPVYVNFVMYDGGNIEKKSGERMELHAVVIVGYNSHRTDHRGGSYPAYLLRNSWGTPWGYKGYGWIEERTLFSLLDEAGHPLRIIEGLASGTTGDDSTDDSKKGGVAERIKELWEDYIQLQGRDTHGQFLKELQKHKKFFASNTTSYHWERDAFYETCTLVSERYALAMEEYHVLRELITAAEAVKDQRTKDLVVIWEKLKGATYALAAKVRGIQRSLDPIKAHVDAKKPKKIELDTKKFPPTKLAAYLQDIENDQQQIITLQKQWLQQYKIRSSGGSS